MKTRSLFLAILLMCARSAGGAPDERTSPDSGGGGGELPCEEIQWTVPIGDAVLQVWVIAIEPIVSARIWVKTDMQVNDAWHLPEWELTTVFAASNQVYTLEGESIQSESVDGVHLLDLAVEGLPGGFGINTEVDPSSADPVLYLWVVER